MKGLFLGSVGHKERFSGIVQQLGKVRNGEDITIDTEYGAALYILTSQEAIWERAKNYVSRVGIDFGNITRSSGYSSSELTMVRLAGNLFNKSSVAYPCDIADMLDDSNFAIAIFAIRIRHEGLKLEDL